MRRIPTPILLAVVIATTFATARAQQPQLSTLFADLSRIEAALPSITAAAARAVKPILDGGSLVVLNDAELASQFAFAPGGMNLAVAGAPQPGDVALAFTDDRPAAPQCTVIELNGCDRRHIVAWLFHVELFAACTRAGKTPVVRLHTDIDTRRRWHRQYADVRFHDDKTVAAIAPGELAGRYLAELRRVLRDLGDASWDDITRTARRAADTRIGGGHVFLRTGGRFAASGDLFTPLEHDGTQPGLLTPGRGDFVIAVGGSQTPGSWQWGEPEMLRLASRKVTWVVGAHVPQPKPLPRGEIVVDQQWPFGDALVKVDGYKPRLAPGSAVVAPIVVELIAHQAQGEIDDHAAHSKRPLPERRSEPAPRDEDEPENDRSGWQLAVR